MSKLTLEEKQYLFDIINSYYLDKYIESALHSNDKKKKMRDELAWLKEICKKIGIEI